MAEAEGLDVEVRYAFYRIYEVLEGAASQVRTASRSGPPPAAISSLAGAVAARWDLAGALAGATDEDLDRDPGGGEWTLRQTLGHVINGQRAYAWFTAWWIERGDAEFLARVPDDAVPGFPNESTEAPGGIADILRRLDDILDLTIERYGLAGPDVLGARARWSGYPVTAAFRLARGASHLREHTVQVDKTTEMFVRQQAGASSGAVVEVPRLLRVVSGAYGRLEAALLEASGDGGTAGGDGAAGEVVLAALHDAAGEAADAREAAAALPGG